MKKIDITITVNGDRHELTVDPGDRLIDVLRDQLNLTGTKEGCGEGECGACTVLINGRAVCCCMLLAVEADGDDITTIEGLAKNGVLHPLQTAFIEHGAAQCGYCTPGMILAAKALLDENPKAGEAEIKQALAGNFCRCTGYASILKAVRAVAERGSDG